MQHQNLRKPLVEFEMLELKRRFWRLDLYGWNPGIWDMFEFEKRWVSFGSIFMVLAQFGVYFIN